MQARPLLITVMLLTMFAHTRAQTIATFAGQGISGYTGNGGPALQARMSGPTGIAIDKNHNLYIADNDNHCVRMVSGVSGVITTYAGNTVQGYGGDGGLATNAQLDYPTGVAVDANGNLYIADYDNNAVRKVDAITHIITTVAGTGNTGFNGDSIPATQANVWHPTGMVVDNAGNIFIVDHGNNRIRKVNALTGIITTIGGNGAGAYGGDGGPATAASLSQPYGICMDAAGNLFIADNANNRVRRINAATGIITTVAGTGQRGYNGDGMPAAAANITTPVGIGIDTAGNIYIADLSQRIRRVDKYTGYISTVAGTGKLGYHGDGGPAVQATLNNPWDVRVDVNGDIYIADFGNFVIRKIKGCQLPEATSPAASSFICTGSGVGFTAASVGAQTYQWQVNTGGGWANAVSGGVYAGTQTSSISMGPVTVGMNNYLFRCVVGNTCGSNASLTDTLKVATAPAVAVVSIGGGCKNDTLAVTPADSLLKIVWYGGATGLDSAFATNTANTGVTVAGGNGQGIRANQLNYPEGVFVDGTGNVFVSDYGNYRVQRWSPGANVGLTVAGGKGQGNGPSQLNGPEGIFVDGAGNMFISDYGNYRVQEWNPGAANGTTVAGGNGQGQRQNQFDLPVGLWNDNQANIYIADNYNNRVQQWQPGATTGTTVAGGQGQGTATNQLNQPTGVFVDANGNLYIADNQNNRVQKWAPGATAGTTVAGGNGAGSAANQLNIPYSLFVDKAGNMYVADQGNNRIQKWAPGAATGVTVAGGNGAGAAPNQLNAPRYVYVDNAGNIYVSDNGNNRVQKWVLNNRIDSIYVPTSPGVYHAVVTTAAGCSVTTNAVTVNNANTPGVAISASSTTICAGTVATFTASAAAGGTVQAYQWQVNGVNVGTNTSTYSSTHFANGDVVRCIANTSNTCFGSTRDTSNGIVLSVNAKPTVKLVNAGGNCLGADTLFASTASPVSQITWNNGGQAVDTVTATDTTSTGITVVGNNGGGNGTSFSGLWGSFVDPDGNLYISDAYNSRVLRFPPGSATGVTVAGGNGRGAAANQLYEPEGLYIDATGNVFVADWANNRVQKWAPNATSGTTVAGGNGAGNTAKQLNWPSGVYGDASGNIYVADFVNSRIQKWAPGATSGVTVAGSVIAGAGAGQLDEPTDVFVDAQGNLYISDFNNNRVQKWVPGATSGTTVAGGNGKGSAANQLNQPYSVFVDGSGDVYVSDWGNSRIQKWLPGATSGITVAGGTGPGPGANQLHSPYSLYVDGSGDIYIADGGNNRVQKWVQQFVIDSTYIPTTAGTYTVVVSNTAGCTDTAGTAVINPSVKPTITINTPTTGVCIGATVNFTTGIANGGGTPTYQWLVNGIKTGGNTSVYSTSTLSNGDVVSCLLASNATCAVPAVDTSNADTITVSAPVNASTTIADNAGSVCPGAPITFTATPTNGGPAPAYQWLVNGVAGGPDSAAYTTAVTDGDKVTCVVTSNAACVNNPTDTSNSIVVAVQAAIVPYVAINAPVTTICAGTAVTLSAVPTNGGTQPVYQWLLNGAPTGGNSTSLTSSTLANGDSVTCVMTPSLGCAAPAQSSAVYITVNPLPQVSFNPDTVYVTGASGTQLSPLLGGATTQYQWAPAAGLSSTAVANPLANPANTTTYLLTATTTQGCSATGKITVLASLPLLIPSAFTPNGDGKNDVFRIPPGVRLVLDEFDVFDRWGNKVFTTKNIAQGWDGTVNGQPVAPGAYVYMIKGATATGEPVFLKGTVVLIR